MPGLTKSGYLQLLQGGIHILEGSTGPGTLRNSADRWKVAFYTTSATINDDTTAYITTNEVGTGGYVTGGETVTLEVTQFTDGADTKIEITFPDIEYTGSPTFTAGYALLYNNTTGKGNAAIAWWDLYTAGNPPTLGVTATGTTFSFGPQAAQNMAPIVFTQ